MFDNLKSAIAAEINAKDNSLFLTPHKKTLSAEKQAAFAEKKKAREIQKKFAELDRIAQADDLQYFEVVITFKRSRTWGWNPHAEAIVNCQYKYIGKASGCGYDKKSTACAEALNQSDSVLKALYQVKNANPEKRNHDCLGYGSGYGILPYLEGGVGLDSFAIIFTDLGYIVKHRQYNDVVIFSADKQGAQND